MTDAQAIIDRLGLQPHPEGGWFTETYRQDPGDGSRGASTAIYYLLERGQRSHWHRVLDADEVWHWYSGSTLRLSRAAPGEPAQDIRLGPDLAGGEQPQSVIPAGHWQAAERLGDWTLVGCTVAPAFDFAGFEMAPPDWAPPKS